MLHSEGAAGVARNRIESPRDTFTVLGNLKAIEQRCKASKLSIATFSV